MRAKDHAAVRLLMQQLSADNATPARSSPRAMRTDEEGEDGARTASDDDDSSEGTVEDEAQGLQPNPLLPPAVPGPDAPPAVTCCEQIDRAVQCCVYASHPRYGNRGLFAMWLSLLVIVLGGSIILLTLHVATWSGVAVVGSGNTKEPIGVCDKTKGPCDCWAYTDFGKKWVNAALHGKSHKLGDDDFFLMHLNFHFVYYGVSYSTVRISSNGYFSFGTSNHTKFGNTQHIPHKGKPDNMVAVYWSDFDPAGEAVVWTRSTNKEFIIEWKNIAHFGP